MIIPKKIITEVKIRKRQIMESDIVDKVQKAIKKALKDGNIKQLLDDCQSDSEKKYIQKFAETEIAAKSAKMTYQSYLFALIVFLYAILISSIPNFYLEWYLIVLFLIIIALLTYAYASGNNPSEKKIDIYKKIILAIEAEKLTNNINSEVDTPPSE